MCVFFLSSLLFCAELSAGSEISISRLTTEYCENPIGVEAVQPRLSWVLDSDDRGQVQTAYQILVADSESKLKSNQGTMWDSGKISSDQTLEVLYCGKPLESGRRYFWKVNVWDRDNRCSGHSKASFFEMGLLKKEDWHGQWIGYNKSIPGGGDWRKPGYSAPMLRKEFTLGKSVTSARVYICGLGLYDLRINGKAVDDSVLNPAHTHYLKTVNYKVYDVTRLLKTGSNCIAVELGKGFFEVVEKNAWNWEKAAWYGPVRMICDIKVHYANGVSQTIASDDSWEICVDGPTIADSIYDGEHYDSRKEKAGWDLPGYSGGGFGKADIMPAPAGQLKAEIMPGMKVVRTLTPVSVKQPKKDCFVFDAGEVVAGWATFTMSCPAGTKITLKYGEKLNDDGTLRLFDVCGVEILDNIPPQTDVYIFKDDKTVSWTPKFNYKGFQYIEIADCPVPLTPKNIEIQVIHTAVRTIGDFACSNSLFNRIHQNVVRSIPNNMHGKLTDTPTYEKNGWMGDAQVIMETALYNFDMTSLLEKWSHDMRDCMRDDGLMPEMVPTGGEDWGMVHSSEWNSAYLSTMVNLNQYCGNKSLAKAHYQSLLKYGEYEITVLKDFISSSCLNDWAAVGADPHDGKPGRGCAAPEGGTLSSTAYAYWIFRTISQIATNMNDTANAEKFATIARDVKLAFNQKFYDEAKGYYVSEIPAGYRQTSSLLPLAFNMPPEEKRPILLSHLLEDVKARDYHLNTGLLGTKFLLPVLTEAGFGDAAYKIADQKTYPGWGYMISQGATSTWETWEPACRSYNHFALGTVDEWFYKYLAGIRCHSDGYREITINPHVLGELTFVNASTDTVRGKVSSEWAKNTNNTMTLKVTVPVGSTAAIMIPAKSDSEVKESGRPAARSAGVEFISRGPDTAVYRVGSGSYTFISQLPQKSISGPPSILNPFAVKNAAGNLEELLLESLDKPK
jgi:alpha-L-rhamnosidase